MYHHDHNLLCHKSVANETNISSCVLFSSCFRRDIPDLFSELTSLYSLPVLDADYDFKIARQDYELSKQDQILYYLFRQKSRNEFLRLGFDSELKRLQETFFLMGALRSELSSMSEELTKRIVSCIYIVVSHC